VADPIILIVDDEPLLVRLCQRVLEAEGFQVLATTSSGQALDILNHTQVNLLLVDLRMPGLDGFQLAALARHNQPDLAVVLMTGFGTLDTAIGALQQGMDGLLLKPFDIDTLSKTVKRVYDESEQKHDAVRSRALRPLFDISRSLFSETVPSQLLDLIIETVCQQMNCPYAGYYQRKDENNHLKLLAGRGEWLPVELQPYLEAMLNTSMAQDVVMNATRDGKGSTSLQAYLAMKGLGSIICVSASHKDNNSYLLVARPQDAAPFREVDVELLLILAGQSSAALENANLYSELRSYVLQVEKSQHALLQAEKMASAGRLTASIAHEINNPLQSLDNCLHLAGRKELSPRDRQKYLVMAQSELNRMMATVQRMLDFYRPGARDRQLSNLNNLVERVVNLMGQQLQKNGIIVHLELAPSLPMVMVVANQVHQVLINLLINAMEAMPGGGEIFIETDVLPHREHSAGKKHLVIDENEVPGVEILICDTGPGIPPEEQEHVFEPFYSTKETGTGLGLSVSYGIITAHEGTLSLINWSGKGACFRITLPEEEKK
jgi:two-component system, NtrC family, sensor kinase